LGISANEPSAARNGTVEAVAPARVRGASRGARLETTDHRIEERPRGWVARDPLRRRILALADVCTVGAVSATLALLGPGLSAALGALLFLPGFILAAKLCGLYDRDHRTLRHLTADELPYLLIWAIVSVGGLALFLQLTSLGSLDAATAIRALVVALAAALVLRAVARFAWRCVTPPERVLIVGRDELTRSIRRKLELFSDIHATVVAAYPKLTPALQSNGRWPLGVDRLILAAQSIDERVIAEVVAVCRRSHVKLSVVPPARGIFGTAVQLHHVADVPVVEYNTWDVSRSTLLLKRVFDVATASVLLLVTAPILLAVVVAERLGGEGSVFYVQRRAGLGGREFRMYKFRTMRPDAEALLPALVRFDQLDEPMFKLTRDPRVTRLGRVLRRTSLDELPQLVNVLKGEMSLVGPRPEQVELVRRYRPEHVFRLAVKPGLTGPMQVFGRGELRFEERLAVERDYIENLSISRDLRILALTVPSVICGRGAY
jgi:exopolysaccharide biosynthesis polyprenyl glycosylphosphotransferase